MTTRPSKADRRAALLAYEDDVEPLADYIARVTPKYAPIPAHHRPIIDVLEETRRRAVFATISMPPRGGKTETLAHGLAWRIAKDPACLNFYATFGDGLAQQTSRRVRRLARLDGIPLADDAQGVHDWRTVLQGGLKATSVGGDVTGRGCNSGLLVADDLVKGREFAESKLNRDRAWDWLRDDFMSRWEPGASLIVNMTRWHEDDVIGRLLIDPLGQDWIHIVIPAVVGENGDAVDERDDASARSYWPEVYTLADLKGIRARGEHGWWSLYQQRPYPRGGSMFKRDWFSVVNESIDEGRSVRGWDLAASTERDSAATAGVKIRLARGRLIIEDVVWKQGTPYEVEELIVRTAEQDGPLVTQSLPQDPGQAGKAQKSYLASKLHGMTVHFSTETGSKELRAEPLAAQAQAGNVVILRGHWNDALLAELESFPVGRMKDRVDAASRAYAGLIAQPETTENMGGFVMSAGGRAY
jgi:predicted phage terminase large subunit-like protein